MNIELTKAERKEIRRTLKSAIDMARDFVRPDMKKTYRFEPKVTRRIQATEKRLPALRSALRKMSAFEKSYDGGMERHREFVAGGIK